MRPRIDGPDLTIASHLTAPGSLRDAQAVAELFIGVFRRDLLGFLPQTQIEAVPDAFPRNHRGGPEFRLIGGSGDGPIEVEMFGARHALLPRDGTGFSAQDRGLIRAIGAVLSLRYHHAFQAANSARLELFRGGSEDHYIAAFVEPSAYTPPADRPSRIASTIQTLRTAALSTYENHRVSTGALLLGPIDDPSHPPRTTPPDAQPYGVGLTGLKSIHRLCDGERTLFLVDRDGNLAEIIDIERWATAITGARTPEIPCAGAYQAHASATRAGGHVCLVLSPNQEIKLFAGGAQAFAFAHGHWRILDPAAKFAAWRGAVADPDLARVLFQAALNLAEGRQGGLFVVINEPDEAAGRLIAREDLLSAEAPCGPPPELAPRDPLARRALHYLARGRNAKDLDSTVLEALARVDGALATDRDGRLLAFGAILRHQAADLPGFVVAEGARTTAALVASRFGPVLKVSEDGVISCFLDGLRAWDL